MVRSVRYIATILALILLLVADKNHAYFMMWTTLVIIVLWSIAEIADAGRPPGR